MDKSAFYVAKQSDGYSHFKGNGYLVLTEDELYFERRVVRKLIIVPAGAIIKAERTKRLAGKSVGKMMLKVVFLTQTGQPDAIAWRVKELEQWISEISALAENTV